MISDFIVNISLLTTSTFVWHHFFHKSCFTTKSISLKIVDGLIGGVLGIVLMYYSAIVNEITILDLRHIPVILAAYYGGLVPAIISGVIISVGRFIMDVNFSSIVSLFMMIMIAFGASAIVHFTKAVSWKKWLYLLLYSQFVFTFALYIVVDSFYEVLDVAIYHILSSILGGLLTFYFVSYIRKYSEMYDKYKENSERDSLTGLYNVRSFDYYYNLMVERAKMEKESCAVILIDIDFFKKVNDNFGHLAGDDVLRQLAKLLESVIRKGDIVSRNGGEEFSMLLLECKLNEAEEIASRIRKIVEAQPFVLPDKKIINITVSIGVASYDGEEIGVLNLYKEADGALYKAKQDGRNKVCSPFGCSL